MNAKDGMDAVAMLNRWLKRLHLVADRALLSDEEGHGLAHAVESGLGEVADAIDRLASAIRAKNN